MSYLANLFKQYTGALRGFKGVYVLNNLLNLRKLRHNKELYKQQGIQKQIFSTVGSQDFSHVDDQDIPWLDKPQALERLERHPAFNQFSPQIQDQLRQFVQEGFMILKGFYSNEEVEKLNGSIDQLLEEKQTDFNYTGRKIMHAFRQSSYIDQQFFRNEKLIQLLNFAMGKEVVPFQTINFLQGSEQRAHSDSIHMSSSPEGYLIATWTALENIGIDQGPVFYYPGSHRLPYVTCQDYQSGNTKWTIGERSYKNYEDKIAAILQEHSFEKRYFTAEKGDVLIWHANLLHGGSPIQRKGSSRKSMVAHYFCKDVICYHEISQRPALLDL